MHRVPAFAAVVAVVLGAQLLIPPAPARAAARPGTTISGTIAVNGCVLLPTDLRFEAQPVGVGSSFSRRVTRADPAGVKSARVSRTTDTHLLRFSFTGLVEGGLYQLVIRDIASLRTPTAFSPCGTLLWEGPTGGLVAAGGTSVRLRGYAVRTQLEIGRPSTREWVGADALDLTTDEGAIRTLRWRSNLADITSVELQASTEPFPTTRGTRTACDEPSSGIVLRRSVRPGRVGRWIILPALDFRTVLVPASPTARRTGGSITEAQARAVAMGAPLWLRVVAKRAGGVACDVREDGLPGWAVVSAGVTAALRETRPTTTLTLMAGAGSSYAPPYFHPGGQPTERNHAYLVVKEHVLPAVAGIKCPFLADPLGCALVKQSPGDLGRVLRPGDWFWIDPPPEKEEHWYSPITDGLTDIVTGFIDAVGFLVDQLSQVYASIKAAIVAVVLDVIMAVPLVSDACASLGDTCEKAVQLGLEVGMAAIGLPPELPNFDEVKELGVEYLASEIASQTGIPDELVTGAFEVAQKSIDAIGEKRGGGTPWDSWFEPFLGYRPAVETLVLHKTGGDLPAGLVLQRPPSVLFAGRSVSLPTRWVQDTIEIPMLLDPNLLHLDDPVCHAFIGTGTRACLSSLDGPYIALWYRDRFRESVTTTGCASITVATELATVTLLGNVLETVPPPPPLDVTISAQVQPTKSATWDGATFDGCGG